jgi:hypothetical protein
MDGCLYDRLSIKYSTWAKALLESDVIPCLGERYSQLRGADLTPERGGGVDE